MNNLETFTMPEPETMTREQYRRVNGDSPATPPPSSEGRSCEECGGRYQPNAGKQRFCSKRCSNRATQRRLARKNRAAEPAMSGELPPAAPAPASVLPAVTATVVPLKPPPVAACPDLHSADVVRLVGELRRQIPGVRLDVVVGPVIIAVRP